MNTAAERSEVKNPKTGMTHAQMKEFIRNHFEEFVNRKNLRIVRRISRPTFLITEPMFRGDCLRDLQALYSTSAPHSKKSPTCA